MLPILPEYYEPLWNQIENDSYTKKVQDTEQLGALVHKRVLVNSDIPFEVKETFAFLSLHTSQSILWGYEHFVNPVCLKALATFSVFDDGMCNLALKNPNWTPSAVATLISGYSISVSVVTAKKFLYGLPNSIVTDSMVKLLIAKADSFHQKAITDLVYDFAREYYEMDEALPNSWVKRTIGASVTEEGEEDD